MLMYWSSQALVIIAYVLLGIGLQKKERIEILFFSSLYQIFMLISYILLLGTMGIISSIIALLRNFLLIYNERKGKNTNSYWILILFSLIAIILTIAFYESPVDIFPSILTLVGIYSYWSTSTKITRLGSLVTSGCYIVYSISLSSWFTIICEIYLVVNTIIGYFKFERHY